MVASYIEFVEERLDLGYDYGAVGGMSFRNEIIENGVGEEQRNCVWWFPLGRWQLGERMILAGDKKSLDEVEYLRSFHAARKGSKQGFRFRDWTDYKGINQGLGTTDGVTTKWQLAKNYFAGSEKTTRAITKPVVGTVKIYLDGSYVTPDIDHATGIVAFAVPPDSGQIITADFLFDIPVTFERDEISWQLEVATLKGESLHKLGSVFVKELRLDLQRQWYSTLPLPEIISEPLDLGIITGTNKVISFSNRNEELASGFKSVKANRDKSRVTLKLPGRKITQLELEKILSYFWVCKGRLISFFLTLNNEVYWCRFNSDSLSIKFLHKDGLYEINGLDFYALGNLDFIDNETYVKAIADSSSMQPEDLARVEAAMVRLKDLLKSAIYRTEEATNKYFKGYVASSEERWLFNANQDLRDSDEEQNKQVFLMWVHEANFDYHNTDGTAVEPTETFNSDLTNFLASFGDRNFFKTIVYAVYSESYSDAQKQEFATFERHLFKAIEGVEPYSVALKNYGFSQQTITTDRASELFYLKQLFN